MTLRILSLSSDRELALLRKRILEHAGHDVVAPAAEKEAEEAAAEGNRFDAAIVCYRMWPGSARRLIRMFRENNPGGKLIIMVRMYGEVPDLEGDRYVVGADGPDTLLNVISDLVAAPG